MESDYPHKDKLEADEDLSPLRELDGWKALFAGG